MILFKYAALILLFCYSFDVKYSQNSGAENDVYKKLEDKVKSYEEDDEISANGHVFCRSSRIYRVNEEDKASKQEYTGVDNGTYDRADKDRKVTVEIRKKLVCDSCQKS